MESHVLNILMHEIVVKSKERIEDLKGSQIFFKFQTSEGKVKTRATICIKAKKINMCKWASLFNFCINLANFYFGYRRGGRGLCIFG